MTKGSDNYLLGTLDRIRKLELNNKPTKDRLHLCEHLHQYRVNLNNLINIKKFWIQNGQ